LQPPALSGGHPVDEFMFRTRRGFCEHYASAFTMLARAAGVPARVVTGYQGGEFNPISGRLVVRQSEAHAWSEVWLEGRGWTRVDPTGAVAPDRIELSLGDALPAGESVPGSELRSLPGPCAN
jgi:protein-glutamine gamma-glutamyltransferase